MITSRQNQDKAEGSYFCSAIAYARSLMLVLMPILVLHALIYSFFVLSFLLRFSNANVYVLTESKP